MLSKKQKEALRLAELDENVTEIFYGGAAGSGKSYLGSFFQITRRLLYPGTRGFMGRNTFQDYKSTTHKTFVEVWEKLFKNNPFGVKLTINLHDKVYLFSNGSEILLKDLTYNSTDPEFNTLGGMELTDAFIDEVPGISKKAKEVIWSRIRYKLINDKPVLLMTGNPTNNWVKHTFVMDKLNNPVILPKHMAFVPALLSDNPDDKFKKTYQSTLEKLSYYDKERLLKGNWSAEESVDNPFLYNWNDDKHIDNSIQLNLNRPVIFSIDFNVEPLCGLVIQMDGRDTYIVDQMRISNGDINKLCDNILSIVGENRRGLIKITGDNTGTRRNSYSMENLSAFALIKRTLRLSDSQFIVPRNPMHTNSRVDCNSALYNLKVKVNAHKCPNAVNDFKRVRWDGEHIVKANRNDPDQQADHLDNFRNFVNAFLKPYL
jgi:hypothetical protein